MKKSDLVEVIAAHTGANKTQALQAFDALVLAIGAGLVSEKVVRLDGLGVLSVKQTKGGIRHNPKTMQEVVVEPKNKVFFKALKPLNDLVNG